ncbi:MAG: carbon storage regulator [Acidobacteria bacterium]|nr:MAG: carbon storage regulator [Acidobacteriota bacterium]PIE90587.1 MAG: carbon storage regulator [Acidobacteriota bacterium]
MLVFSRKKNDSIVVGDNVEITVISIGKDFVKLGINAPRSVPIHRKEVYLAIERENRQATASVQAGKLKSIEDWIKSTNLPTPRKKS